jgi:pyrimidine deaminase RibD-like protein
MLVTAPPPHRLQTDQDYLMNTRQPVRALARDLCRRSSCQVQVAAVLVDRHGIFAWGWNHCGLNGMGEHAERHALRRANPRRLCGATMIVFGVRKKNGHTVPSRPCKDCNAIVRRAGIRRVEYHSRDGGWTAYTLEHDRRAPARGVAGGMANARDYR